MRNRNPRTRIAFALAVALGVSAAMPPVWAAAGAPNPKLTPMANAAADRVASADSARGLRAADAPAAAAASPTESRPFFKSPKGAIAIILMAGVTAYTIHSRTCCAIHSPAR